LVVVMVVASLKLVMRCPHCGYEWRPRVERPKKCPRCYRWLERGEKG
jgi:predicted Zn-ribbon and HTH transcriptional regulator